MKRFIFIILFILFSVLSFTQIINIPSDYATIQQGIDAASGDDTILVAMGTYYENIAVSGKHLIIGSKFLTTGDTSYISKTIIDGNHSGSVVTLGPEEIGDTHFSGFTIINGNGNESGMGGGIFVSGTRPVLTNLVISSNSAVRGGGISCVNNSHLYLSNTTIINNSASQKGGGIQCHTSNLYINNCDIIQNIASGQAGGAITFEVFENYDHTLHVNIQSSKFIDNECPQGSTGGIYMQQNGDMNELDLKITDCTFEGNRSKGNNALLIKGDYVHFSILNCSFIENEAEQYCAGAAFIQNSHGKVTNCLFALNHAATGGENWNSGGASVWGGAYVDFLNCAFVENTASYGAGLTVGAGATANLTNCIFWGNENDQIALVDYNENGGNMFAGHCNIQYGQDSILVMPYSELNWEEDFNIELEPVFSGEIDHPYSLAYTSPCIDAGTQDTFGLDLPKYDLIGSLRVWDGDSNGVAFIDMGPYEYAASATGMEETFEYFKIKLMLNIFPNPFTTSTNLSYELKQPDKVILTIYNHLGQLVYQTQENQPQGLQQLKWNAERYSDGIYYYTLQAGEQVTNGKMVKVR